MCKSRERVQELRSQRECEQHKHSVAMTELRVKLHEERQREVAAAREALARQHEAELARLARLREAEVQRLQAQVNALREGGGVNSEVCRLSTWPFRPLVVCMSLVLSVGLSVCLCLNPIVPT